MNARRVGVSARATTSRTSSVATGGTTIYAGNPEKCIGTSTDSGAGTAANPYCSIQDAVNAATNGDVISIANGEGYTYSPITITTSGLTLAAPTGATIENTIGGAALVINGASSVTLSGLGASSLNSTALVIEGSSGINFDSGGAIGNGNAPSISIDGTSSGITISRTQLTPTYDDEADTGISIASGARNIDLASNVMADYQSGAIQAVGVSGLDVVGNTIQRSCGGAVAVTGSSTGVSIENNVFVDINSSNCSSGSLTWNADVTVDSTSAAGTTSDYNDFALYGSTDTDDTSPYSWAAATYASLSAFQGATSQGTHDTNDTTTWGELNAANTWWNMQAVPAWGSPAVYSANLSAPGALITDLRGKSPYNTRGALQYQGPFPALNEFTSLTQTGPYSISVSQTENYAPSTSIPFTVTFDWGDGTKYTQTLTQVIGDYSEPHSYSAYGSYTVTVTLTDNRGDTVTKTLAVNLSAPDPDVSLSLKTAQTGAYTTQLSISSPEPTGLTYGLALNETIGWGDGTTSTSSGAYVGGTYSISHTYKSAGNYAVTVAATDAGGDAAQGSIAVTESDPDPNLVAGFALTGSDTSAHGISVEATTADPGLPYSLALTDTFEWGDGTTSTVSTTAGAQATASHIYAKPGAYTVTVEVTDGTGDSAENSMHVTTAGADYTAYGPARILDTRHGIGAPLAKVQAGKLVRVEVGGNGKIPVGVTAAVVNITVTDTTGPGFVTAYPDDGSTAPGTSNVNYAKGQTVPNMAIVPVGQDGYIDLYNAGANGASVDLVVDISGYFTPSQAAGYTSVTPYRLVDTRSGTGVRKGQIASGASVSVPVAAALPAGVVATAVAVNITATDETGPGVLTAYPDGEAAPSTSNVNYGHDQTIANAAVVPVGADGKIDIANAMAGGSGGTDVVIDVVGYYSASGTGAYVPVEPFRYLDTRQSTWKDGPLEPGAASYFALPMGLDSNDDNQPGITGIVANATVTQTGGSGYLAVAPDPNSYQDYQDGTAVQPTPPTSSTLNWAKGQTVPNLAQISTGSTGIIDFWNLGSPAGPTALVIDVFGYYQND